MPDMLNSKWDIPSSISELESLGLETPKLNELNDSYEVENLVDNLKQMLYQDYESVHIFTDWQIICYPVQPIRREFQCLGIRSEP